MRSLGLSTLLNLCVIKKPKSYSLDFTPKTRTFTPYFTCFMLSFCVICSSNRANASNTAEVQPSALVKTQRPVQQALTETFTAYGSIQSNPASPYSVSLSQAGQIAQLNVSVGQRVSKGTTLAVIKSDPQLLLATTQARSAVTFAQGERTRIAALLSAHLATQSQLASAEKNLIDAKAVLQATLQQGGGQSTQTLRAPADAIVISINNQVGERPAAGSIIMQLNKVMPMQASIGIAPNMINQLSAGMQVSISPVFAAHGIATTAKPNQQPFSSPSFSGVILHTNGGINPQTGRIDLPIKLTPPLSNQLRQGLPIKATIPIKSVKSWVVPRNAVLTDAQGAYIYQVSNQSNRKIALRVPVQIGIQTNQLTAITGAINPKLNIVILGNYLLKNGMQVREQVQ